MNLLQFIFDYIRLRLMGISPSKACEIANFKKSYKAEIVALIMLIAFFLFIAVNYHLASEDYKLVSARYEAIALKSDLSNTLVSLDKFERVAVACLNGETLLIDGIDRPCKVGEFKNERAVF